MDLPIFVYIEQGRKNFSDLPENTRKVLEGYRRKSAIVEKYFEFFMCTKDRKVLFAKSPINELLQFNLRKFTLIRNYGKIYHNFGDLVITAKGIDNSQKHELLRLKNVSSIRSTDDLQNNGEVTIPYKTLVSSLVLGEYFGEDQGWGNQKGSIKFYVNDIQLYQHGPIGRSGNLKEFMIYLEDAFARENDKICTMYSVGGGGGHIISVSDIRLFNIPNLYVPNSGKFNFELGIIGNIDTTNFPGYKLSKYAISKDPETFTLDKIQTFQKPNLNDLPSIQIDDNKILTLESKAHGQVVDLPSSEFGAYPHQWESHGGKNQQFYIKYTNTNKTFRIISVCNSNLVMGVDKVSNNLPKRIVKGVKLKNIGQPEEQQWYWDGKCMVNLAGGYLSVSKNNRELGCVFYCMPKNNNIGQEWKITYVGVLMPSLKTNLMIPGKYIADAENDRFCTTF